jgi:hypothetical protein
MSISRSKCTTEQTGNEALNKGMPPYVELTAKLLEDSCWMRAGFGGSDLVIRATFGSEAFERIAYVEVT